MGFHPRYGRRFREPEHRAAANRRQLAPMMIPVVQHDRTQHTGAWLGKNNFSSQCQVPVLLADWSLIPAQALFGRANTLVESRMNFREMFGGGRIEVSLRRVKLI